MTSIHVARFADTPFGVFGRLSTTTGFQAVTVERPWLDNAEGLSCIPAGTYQAVRSYFNHGGYECVELLNVPGRTEILFHVANTMDDLKGCIGVGRSLGYVKGKWGVLASKLAFAEFMDSLELVGGIEVHIRWEIPKGA